MPKNPVIYKSKTEATDAFIRDVQFHRNAIRKAFNKYGKLFCDMLHANYDDVEDRVKKHDLSKYTEEVESHGVIAYFYRYPEDGLSLDSNRRRYLLEKAMLNHYHMNSCHPEYWLQYKSGNKLVAFPMDDESIVEMVLDWIAIGMEEEFDRADIYWANNRNKKLMTPDTIEKVDILIDVFSEKVQNENHDEDDDF